MDKRQQLEQFDRSLKRRRSRRKKAHLKLFFNQMIYLLLMIIHHTLEMIITLPFLLLSLPVLLVLVLRRIFSGKTIFRRLTVFGRKAQELHLYQFNLDGVISNLWLFWYIPVGLLQLTGLGLKSYSQRERVVGDAYLFNSRPGIFNLWFVRESSRTAFEGRFATEREFISKSHPLKDFLLLLQFIPAVLFRHTDDVSYAESLRIFDITIHNLTMQDAIAKLDEALQQKQKKRVYFVNPDCLNKALALPDYRAVLRSRTDYLFADGIGIVIASKILNSPMRDNVNGTDLLPFLCQMCARQGYRIFLLGAKPGVAEAMQQKLVAKYKGLQIVGTQHGYFNRDTESEAIIQQINATRPDVLLVAFGAPWQEQWIDAHHQQIEAGIQMGVGGLFDFYSETKKRAPRWMRQVGGEWIYRLLLEPGRMWRRYIIGNPYFLAQVIRYRYGLISFEGEQK
jgi:N-acetylglucosaminyldiphosphoundecaprenol N-acetyl-beta-D-mannosaminyltransferase